MTRSGGTKALPLYGEAASASTNSPNKQFALWGRKHKKRKDNAVCAWRWRWRRPHGDNITARRDESSHTGETVVNRDRECTLQLLECARQRGPAGGTAGARQGRRVSGSTLTRPFFTCRLLNSYKSWLTFYFIFKRISCVSNRFRRILKKALKLAVCYRLTLK